MANLFLRILSDVQADMSRQVIYEGSSIDDGKGVFWGSTWLSCGWISFDQFQRGEKLGEPGVQSGLGRNSRACVNSRILSLAIRSSSNTSNCCSLNHVVLSYVYHRRSPPPTSFMSGNPNQASSSRVEGSSTTKPLGGPRP